MSKQPAGFVPSFSRTIIRPWAKSNEVSEGVPQADAVATCVIAQEEWAEEWKRAEQEEDSSDGN